MGLSEHENGGTELKKCRRALITMSNTFHVTHNHLTHCLSKKK